MLINRGEALSDQNVRYVISLVNEGNEGSASADDCGLHLHHFKGQTGQAENARSEEIYRSHPQKHGHSRRQPAGTGKTYLAVAMAVTAFRAKEVNRIILTRPQLKRARSSRFLPGDLQQKVDPYLRPLYDALFDMLGAESFQKAARARKYRSRAPRI